jgi:hypothetical protein
MAEFRPEFIQVLPPAGGDGSGGGTVDLGRLVLDKHREYQRKYRFYIRAYYATRLAAGVCAGLMPFVIPYSQPATTALAIAVVLVTVFDTVFSPKDKAALYSTATDKLALAEIKSQGQYDKFKDTIDVIMQTEAARMQRLVGLQELVEQIKKQAPPPGK